MSGLEVGGLVGGTLAGILSDARIRATQTTHDEGVPLRGEGAEWGGNVGKRVQIVMVSPDGYYEKSRVGPSDVHVICGVQ